MDILKEIKEAVIAIEPDAEVYLFGSRARGDNSETSDWDVLVLLNGKVDYRRKEKVWNILYDIEYKYDLIYSIAVKEKDFWYNNKIYHETEFYKNLSKEMVSL